MIFAEHMGFRDLLAAGLSVGDATTVLRFREFLHVVGPVSNSGKRLGLLELDEDEREAWLAYARGEDRCVVRS